MSKGVNIRLEVKCRREIVRDIGVFAMKAVKADFSEYLESNNMASSQICFVN